MRFARVLRWEFVQVLVCICTSSVLAADYVPDPKNPAAVYSADPSSLPGAEVTPGVVTEAGSNNGSYYICEEQAVRLGGRGTDIWGWEAPDGRKYALMGVFDGLAIFNITDNEIGSTVDFTPGCGWRDIKTYDHYAYVVSECDGLRAGIMVVDLQYLPDSAVYERSVPIDGRFEETSHNISIDTSRGFLYVEGNGPKDEYVHVFSLALPDRPIKVASFGKRGVHDIYARNDTCYTAAGGSGYWEVYDLTDKDSIELILEVPIPNNGYVHNIWINDDRTVAVTTEETPLKTIKVWDISDFGNVQLASQFLGGSDIAHNAHIDGDRVYVSHYESGVIVADISDPYNAHIIAQYDTWATEESSYEGCWGVYPHTGDSTFYLSNRTGILYVINELTSERLDSMYIGDLTVDEGETVRADINLYNSLPVNLLTIPLKWSGPSDLILDSVSLAGTRSYFFNPPQVITSWTANGQRVYRLQSNGAQIMEGDGPVLSAWFSAPVLSSLDANPITFAPLNGWNAYIEGACGQLSPDTVSGSISVTTCCIGMKGDVNGDGSASFDAVDLSFLLDFLFSDGAESPCASEGDLNRDGMPNDGVDLSYAVDFLFNGGPLPGNCLE